MDRAIEMEESGSDVLDGTVWVTALPRWLWLSVFFGTSSLALLGKVFLALPQSGPLLYRLEQLPFAIWWVPALVIALLAGPWIVALHGSRTWLRRYFPEVAALTWSGEGIALKDGRVVPWRDVRAIYMGFSERRERLTIVNDAFGPGGQIHIPKTALLDPTLALDQLKRAQFHYLKRDATADYAAKMATIEHEAKQRLVASYGKTTSQLKAEGLNSGELAELRMYEWTQAAKGKL